MRSSIGEVSQYLSQQDDLNNELQEVNEAQYEDERVLMEAEDSGCEDGGLPPCIEEEEDGAVFYEEFNR